MLRIMSPRRHRDRSVVNVVMEEYMRQLHARLDAMEIAQRRAPEAYRGSKRSCRRTSNKRVTVEGCCQARN